MSNIVLNKNSGTVAATEARDIEMKMAAKRAATATKDTSSNTVVLESSAADAGADEAGQIDAENALGADETGEAADTDSTVEGEAEDTAVTDEALTEEGAIIGEPAPVFEGDMGGEIGFGEGMYQDPSMETGMAEVKDPLLSSWPFVIGISAAVLFVSMALGALLARRKIKKGIELYED